MYKTTNKQDFAFERAKSLQAIASERNKARKPGQYKPDFKAGDLLLLQERAPKEGRLEERDEEGKAIPISEKL